MSRVSRLTLGAILGWSCLLPLVAQISAGSSSPRGGPTGTEGIWEQLAVPTLAGGDYIQSVMADPVNPGSFYIAAGNNDGRNIKWWSTADFGDTWVVRNNTSMRGNPWGFSIDPNPARDPNSLPTLYSPAGYGSLGAWKSTDGAATWTRLAGADAAFGPYNPFGSLSTDLYHVAILPDDPPNHVLATYHYYFMNNTEGGFGETWDGGTTWVIHPPPPGVGTSHYVLPISGTTWCVIAQSNNGTNGIWRTTTAGRVGGTAGAKYRDGTISAAAWSKVSTLEHMHGSFQAWQIPGGTWYVPGWTEIGKSIDQGATWQILASGNWPGTFNGVRSSNLVATGTYVYTNYQPDNENGRALLTNDTVWDRAYCPVTTATGGNPYGTSVAFASSIGKYVILMGSQTGMWRFIEPVPIVTPTAPMITTQPAGQTVASGQSATFNVVAGGYPALSYQWQRSNDGGNTWTAVGSSSPTYVTSPTTPADSGAEFRVIVSNTQGSLTSSNATLTVTGSGGGGGASGSLGGSSGSGGHHSGCGLLGLELAAVWGILALVRRLPAFKVP